MSVFWQVLSRNHNWKWSLANLICVVVGCLIYLPSLNLFPSLDDFYLLAHTFNLQTGWDILQPREHLFRPLEQLAITVNTNLLGFDSFWLIWIIQILAHSLSILLIINIGRKIHLSPPVVLGGGVFFAVLSVNSTALLQIDTTSQTYSTVFILIVYYLWLGMNWEKCNSFWTPLLAGLASLIALFWKETAIGPLLGISLLTLMLFIRNKVPLPVVIRFLMIVVVMPFAIYVITRWLVGGVFQMSEGRYHLSLGLNVIKNVFMLLGGLLYQGSTLDIFPTINSNRFALGFALSFFYSLWLGWSLWLLFRHKGPQIGHLTGTVIMLFASFFPVILSQRVGEVYFYGTAPFLVLVLMLLMDHFLHAHQAAFVVFLFFVILTLNQVVGTLDKQSKMMKIDKLSQYYTEQACDIYTKLPKDAILCWQNGQEHKPEYSLMVQDHITIYRPVSYFCANILTNNIQVLDAKKQTDLEQCTYFIREQNDEELIFVKNE